MKCYINIIGDPIKGPKGSGQFSQINVLLDDVHGSKTMLEKVQKNFRNNSTPFEFDRVVTWSQMQKFIHDGILSVKKGVDNSCAIYGMLGERQQDKRFLESLSSEKGLFGLISSKYTVSKSNQNSYFEALLLINNRDEPGSEDVDLKDAREALKYIRGKFGNSGPKMQYQNSAQFFLVAMEAIDRDKPKTGLILPTSVYRESGIGVKGKVALKGSKAALSVPGDSINNGVGANTDFVSRHDLPDTKAPKPTDTVASQAAQGTKSDSVTIVLDGSDADDDVVFVETPATTTGAGNDRVAMPKDPCQPAAASSDAPGPAFAPIQAADSAPAPKAVEAMSPYTSDVQSNVYQLLRDHRELGILVSEFDSLYRSKYPEPFPMSFPGTPWERSKLVPLLESIPGVRKQNLKKGLVLLLDESYL